MRWLIMGHGGFLPLLSKTSNISFSFFVKIDDVFFSLQNKFTIVTMNGINMWRESFLIKDTISIQEGI